MNEKDFKKELEILKKVKMTSEEKTRLLKNILETPVKSPYLQAPSFFFYNLSRVRVTIASLLIVVMSFGGILYASDSSLPGDTLYSIKVNIVESALDKVNNTVEEKIVWEEEKVQRRIHEAEKLAEKEELDEERSGDLGQRIENSSKAFVEAVNAKSSQSSNADKNLVAEEAKNRVQKFREKVMGPNGASEEARAIQFQQVENLKQKALEALGESGVGL